MHTVRDSHYIFLKHLTAAFACSIAFVSSVCAQDYPSKPLRIVVPFAAAGTSDLVSRIVGNELSILWDVPVIIDNRPGAGGNLGSDLVAKSQPDGYTMLMGTVATHAINSTLFANMTFDHIKDFEPVSLVASTPSVLEVNLNLPVNS